MDGQDNGLNAWLDYELNKSDMDEEFQHDVVYAKRNSDNNKFYNIDDVPIRGPPRDDDDIKSVISLKEATETANALLNEDDLFICRNTGIMKKRADAEQERGRIQEKSKKQRSQPSSTVTRMDEIPDRREDRAPRWRDRNKYRNREAHVEWQDDYHGYNRYDQQPAGWDTDIELVSDDEALIKYTPREIQQVKSDYRYGGTHPDERGYSNRYYDHN